MCWSAKVSLNTFLVSVFAAWLAWWNGYGLAFAGFVMAYAAMQLVEFVVWRWGLKDSGVNALASMAGALVLMIQPLAAIMLMNEGRAKRWFLWAYVGFWVVTIASRIGWPDRIQFKSSVGGNGHLRWHFVNDDVLFTPAFVAYLVLLLLPLLLTVQYRWVFAFGLVTLVGSMWTYLQYRTWGTIWCWVTNAISVALIAKIVFWDHFCEWRARNSKDKSR